MDTKSVSILANSGNQQTFNFNGIQIRTILINNDPWFVVGDVCKALELGNVTRATERLDEDEKGFTTIQSLGGMQTASIISESGLYSSILTSRKPEAKTFKRWITHEVLPAIRKTGSYLSEPMSVGEMLVANAQAFLAL